MNRNTSLIAAAIAAGAIAAVAGCASTPGSAELDAQTLTMMRGSFRDQGIAKLDRLNQDTAQKACSGDTPPPEAVAKQIETESMATVRWPTGGQYLGDWKQGEKLAQSGRGMSWSDASDKPSDNGGSCYNCHQVDNHELSFGTIGPSLWNYGKLRGVKSVTDPASAAVVQYTWGKLWNAKATNACSLMPRFGHAHILDEAQIRDLMALLLDPKSPVNQ